MIARNTPRRPRDIRQQMISETEAFLNWALAEERCIPSIPRRRSDRGGFSELLNRPMAKTITAHWWSLAIKRIDRFS